MSKNDSLKDSMKGGLNGLFSSTAPAKNSLSKDNLSEEKEKVVHCNFLINKSIHTRMKYLAIDKNMSLKDIVNQAMLEYLEKNETTKEANISKSGEQCLS